MTVYNLRRTVFIIWSAQAHFQDTYTYVSIPKNTEKPKYIYIKIYPVSQTHPPLFKKICDAHFFFVWYIVYAQLLSESMFFFRIFFLCLNTNNNNNNDSDNGTNLSGILFVSIQSTTKY